MGICSANFLVCFLPEQIRCVGVRRFKNLKKPQPAAI